MSRQSTTSAGRNRMCRIRLVHGHGRRLPARPVAAEPRRGDDPDGLLRRAMAGHFRDDCAEDLVLAWMAILRRRAPALAAARLLPRLVEMAGNPPTHQQTRLLALVESIAVRSG